MSNAIRCIDQRFAFKNSHIFVSDFDIQDEKSKYDSPVRQKISSRWRDTTSHIPVRVSSRRRVGLTRCRW